MPQNLVINPGFENGTANWTVGSGAVITTAQSHSGDQCIKITNGAELRKDDPAEHFATMAGEVWSLSIWMKNESFVGPGGVRLQRQLKGESTWADLASTVVPAIGAGWVKMTATATATSSIAKIRARTAFAGTGIIYVDDVELITGIDSLPSEPSESGDTNHDDLHDEIHKGTKNLKSLITLLDSAAVRNIGNQTVAGVKTFSSSPLLTGAATAGSMITKSYADTGFAGKQASFAAGTTSQYFRGDKTWATLDKTAAGLSAADNTSDANKPVSTALQAALDGKEASIALGTSAQFRRGDKIWTTLQKSTIGLTSVDNTADLDKPISTATQAALDAKANAADILTLSGAQTISGIKTFSGTPKFVGSSTVGHVWTATSTDGSGSWQSIGTPVTTVDYANTTVGRPSTFSPTIGTTATTAAAGNHTHTKAEVGLSNVDNTSDLGKPITTAETTALNALVTNTRTISAGTALETGGTLAADRTLSISNGGVDIASLAVAAKKEGITYVQSLTTRAVGLNQIQDGFILPFNCNVVSVKYRMGTADASGTTTVELRKNDVAVSGTSGTAALSPTSVTGTWAFSAGDKLTVYTTAIGTTPGQRLTADIIIERS